MTIRELRNAGYKVKILHNRLYNGVHIWQRQVEPVDYCGPIDPDPKGGSTTIIIDSPFGDHFEGHAVCSRKENYHKKMGVRIAMGRSGIFNYLEQQSKTY